MNSEWTYFSGPSYHGRYKKNSQSELLFYMTKRTNNDDLGDILFETQTEVDLDRWTNKTVFHSDVTWQITETTTEKLFSGRFNKWLRWLFRMPLYISRSERVEIKRSREEGMPDDKAYPKFVCVQITGVIPVIELKKEKQV